MKCSKCKTSFDPVCPKCNKPNLNYFSIWVAIVLLFLGICWSFVIIFPTMRDKFPVYYNDGYKQGQIDALNNHWEYDQIIQGKLKSDTIYIKIK